MVGDSVRTRGVLLVTLVALLASATPAGAQAVRCVLCGDVNGDGVIDAVDALQTAQAAAGLRGAIACPLAADVTADRWIDDGDTLAIAWSTVGQRILCDSIGSP
jgi:hypothetical protein